MSWNTALLVVWLVWLGVATMFPYEFTSAGLVTRLSSVVHDARGYTASELAHNVALFVPLGILVSRTRAGSRSPARAVALACLTGLLLSLCIESLQLFLPRRDPTLLDVAANGVGSGFGGAAYIVGGPRAEEWLEQWRTRFSPTAVVIILAGYAAMWAYAGAVIQRQSRLSNWDPEYPLQVGNERTGSRPWRGRVFLFDISDAPIPRRALDRFAYGVTTALPGSPVTQLDFSGDPPYRDAAGGVPPLEWTGPDGGSRLDGVRLAGQPWLRTGGPASTLVRRLVRSNAFSIRLVCASDDLGQEGPARIVSSSVDENFRNLTIAQHRRDLVVRIRTPHTGRNGSRPEVIVPGVFSDFEPRDIAIAYDGANVLVAVAGSNQTHSVPFSPGPILVSRQVSIGIEADEHRALEWAFFAVMFVPPAAFIGAVVPGPGRRMAVGGVFATTFALVFERALMHASGRPFGWDSFAVSVTIGVLAVVAFAATPPARDATGAAG